MACYAPNNKMDMDSCSVDKSYVYEVAGRKCSFFLEHIYLTEANTASWMENLGFIEEED